MDRAVTRSLAKFCADQYFAFDPNAWVASDPTVRKPIVAAAARYLSHTNWYGREAHLARIAATLGRNSADGSESAQADDEHDLDLGYFSSALRIDIASRRMASVHATDDRDPYDSPER